MREVSRQEVSIEDIARAASVSHSTVSRALQGSSLISVDVRERIQRIADQMGYTPNAVARSLQTRRTNTIGLVVTSIADPFFSDVVRGVEEVARAAKFSVFLSASYNESEQEKAIIDSFHQRRVDGILIASSRISSSYEAHLNRTKLPIVLVNSQVESQAQRLHWVAVDDAQGVYSIPTTLSQKTPALHWVTVDDAQGAQLAVGHLLQLGHRAIGYLGTESRPKSNRHRLEGYQGALAAAGIVASNTWIAIAPELDTSAEEDALIGRTLLPRLLDEGVTAVFCYNDMLAVGALLACHERGISVPRDISIVGFDDTTIAGYVTPPLTTVHQPKLQLGSLAAEMLLNLLNERPVENAILVPTLTLRASTAPLARC